MRNMSLLVRDILLRHGRLNEIAVNNLHLRTQMLHFWGRIQQSNTVSLSLLMVKVKSAAFVHHYGSFTHCCLKSIIM